MGKRRQSLRLVGLALALALVAAACGGGGNQSSTSGGQQATPQKGGVLRTGISDFGFTNGFDPTGEYVAVAIGLYGAMERTLMGYKHVANEAGNELVTDLAEAALSFLGVGVPQTTPSWGRMLSDAAAGQIFTVAWWMMLFPGLFLLATTLSFNLVGDGLRDALGPTQR